MHKLSKYILCLLLMNVKSIVGLTQTSITMTDIHIVYNLDSMIELIPSLDKHSNAYINHLIHIEKSRIVFGSYKQGAFLYEIDSLSKRNSYSFGRAFYYYAAGNYYNNYSPENTNKPTMLAKKALTEFSALNDNEGKFLSNILIARTYVGYLRYLDNNNLKEKNKELKTFIHQKFNSTIHYYLNEAKKIAESTKNSSFLIQLNYYQSSILGDTYLTYNKNKVNLQKGISMIQTCPEEKHWLIAYYNLYGNILVDQDSISEAIWFHRKALSCNPQKESDFNYVLYNNLGSDFDDLHQSDSAVYYYKKSLVELNNNKEGDPLIEILVHNQIAENLEKLNKIQEALLHKKIAFDLLQTSSNKSMLNAFNLQKKQEIIQQKELNEKTLSFENKNAQLKLWIGSMLFISLAFATFFILRSRKKLNNAYLHIQELQSSREKFYSLVSHDLRSHLDSYVNMAAMVSYLLKTKNYLQIEKIAAQIDKSGLLLKNLLQNLFQWSVSQRDHLSFDVQDLNLEDQIETILMLFEQMAEFKHVTFSRNIVKGQIIRTDINYLSTVIRNLIDNALKNSPIHSTINIQTETSDMFHLLSIQNNSTISDEQFQNLQTFLNSTQEWQVGKLGIGLGLILIKEFVSKMQGSFKIDKLGDQITCKVVFPKFL